VNPENEDAVCFCVSGALLHADSRPWKPFDALTVVVKRNIIQFNDDPATTHADVLAAFDRAIALAETA
jgi:hypothetical protein